MAFQDIIGNSRVKKILKLALARRRVPNSLLFCGPEGVGKKETALVLAKALNCLRKTDDACDECDHCRAIDGGVMPDVLDISVKDLKAEQDSREDEAGPEEGEPGDQAVRDTIGIKTMKSIKEIAHLRPMLGRKRVFIIDEAEKMTPDAAGAHLKILEEPPLSSHIILISKNPDLMPSTIRSRCQTLTFLPIGREEIEQALCDKGIEEGKARIMALLARGNLEQALDLEWDEIQRRRSEAFSLFLALVGKEESSAFLKKYAYQRRKEAKEDFVQTLELFSSFCRDVVLLKEGGDPRLLFNPDYEQPIRKGGSLIDFERALRFLGSIDLALANLDDHLNMSLLVSSLYSQILG